MKKYEKPIVMINEELAEGVYAYSGYNDGECYTVRCSIKQTPREGFPYYKIQINADHAVFDHHSSGQVLEVTFDTPVTYDTMTSGNPVYVSGNGTMKLVINTYYHSECNELGVGLGELSVIPVSGVLTTVSAVFYCNTRCAQHDHLGNY